MEEKKLTDDEIVKDIERSTGMPSYWKKIVLDLIHRLQGENKRLEKLLDDKCDRCIERGHELQKQVDELTTFKNEAISLSLYGKGRKDGEEVATKDTAERVQQLEEALLDMVVQFCQISDDDTLRHSFMSAEENAFDVLDINYGEKVSDVYRRFQEKWTKPVDEICKELTEGKV